MGTDIHGLLMLGGRRLMCLALLSSLICATPLMGAAAAMAATDSVAPALKEKPYLYEVVRHLYRWYMDEADAERVVQSDEYTFWVRELHPKLDQGDRSQLGLIVIPNLGIAVKVKRAEYEIPELEVSVKNEAFKIVNVERRSELPDTAPEGFEEVKASFADMRAYLFRTRNQLEFPEGEFLKSLRLAVREEIREELENREKKLPDAEPTIHFSSISPVANELWVFWETGRILMRIASDIDLANPDVWGLGEMAVKMYDIDEQVVVSLHEVAGSNAYMTRDQVGRALFNCIVLGKRVVLEALEEGD